MVKVYFTNIMKVIDILERSIEMAIIMQEAYEEDLDMEETAKGIEESIEHRDLLIQALYN